MPSGSTTPATIPALKNFAEPVTALRFVTRKVLYLKNTSTHSTNPTPLQIHTLASAALRRAIIAQT